MSTESAPAPTIAAEAATSAPAVTPAGDSAASAPAAPSVEESLYPASPENVTTPESVSSEEGAVSEPEVPETSPETEAAPETPALTVESYGDFTLPEGWAHDTELEGNAKKVFAEVGVPPDKAQSLMDLYTSAVDRAQKAATEEFNATQAKWKTEIDSLPDFKGATRATTLTAIGKLFDTYGDDGLRELMAHPAVGNSPPVLKFLAGLAKALDEGAPSAPGRPAHTDRNGRAAPKTVADTLYPNS